MSLFELYFFNVLCIIGLHVITRDGYIFGFVERWIGEDHSPLWDPVIQCPTCMGSVWGALFFIPHFMATYLPWGAVFFVLPYCVAVAGGCHVIGRLISK